MIKNVLKTPANGDLVTDKITINEITVQCVTCYYDIMLGRQWRKDSNEDLTWYLKYIQHALFDTIYPSWNHTSYAWFKKCKLWQVSTTSDGKKKGT